MKFTAYIFSFFVTVIFSVKAFAQSEGFKTSDKNILDSSGKWSYHFQLTTVYQTHPSFHSSISGANSLNPNQEEAISLTTTMFIGRKLWKNASFYFNPEISGGKGLSEVVGMGGAFNGETFRVGTETPTPYVARAYIQQHFAIGNSKKSEELDNEINQVEENVPSSRITVSAGKFGLSDFFDHNAYSHDPRTQFMNWSLMSGTGWDYPANVRGYTWGFVVEIIKPTWEIRLSSALVPLVPNGAWMDWNYSKAHSETFEIEKKMKIRNRPGKVRFLLYNTLSKAASYKDATAKLKTGDSSMVALFTGDLEWSKYGGRKYGFCFNFDQEIFDGIGIFGRASWGDGHTSIWAFTEVDESASLGLSVDGKRWKRTNDRFGLAFVLDGLSQDHIDYLNAGGKTFMLGDGKGNYHYGYEQIVETYYSVCLSSSLWISFDYQYAANPGYNQNRGPVHVFGLRTHLEF